MAISLRERKQELEDVIERAMEFHGHLGPFLVIGVRMALIGMRELEVKKGDPKLRVVVVVKPSVPFSCVIDGIQAATTCTIGNRKLRLQNSPKKVAAKFQILEGDMITITLDSAKQTELEKLLSKKVDFREMEKIALNVASMSEKELFKVKRK
ncbi:MAG: FmdE family protein [Candidatus Bathyarchaeota archaeon]